METHYFWAFFVIALIVGGISTLAYTSYTNSMMTGAAFWHPWTPKPWISPNPWIKATCKDSDGGWNIYERGTCISEATNSSLAITDYCLTNESAVPTVPMLREFYCSGSSIKHKDVRCSNGCSNGACIKENESEEVTYRGVLNMLNNRCNIGQAGHAWPEGNFTQYNNCNKICSETGEICIGAWYYLPANSTPQYDNGRMIPINCNLTPPVKPLFNVLRCICCSPLT